MKSDVASLSLDFLLCKMGPIIAPSPGYCCEESMRGCGGSTSHAHGTGSAFTHSAGSFELQGGLCCVFQSVWLSAGKDSGSGGAKIKENNNLPKHTHTG